MPSPLKLFVCLIALFMPSHNILSQNAKIESLYLRLDSAYGNNHILYNGKKYYELNPGAWGTPGFMGNKKFTSDLFIHGDCYKHHDIMYELHQQCFILFFKNINNAEEKILIDTISLDSIYLEDMVFVKNPYPSINNRYLQTILTDSLSAFITYKKDYLLVNGVRTGYKYSKTQKSYYLVMNNEVMNLPNRKYLRKIFPRKKQRQIRHFIIENNIKIKKMDSRQFRALITYCNTLLL